MATYDKTKSAFTREPSTRAELLQIAGIPPELIDFVDQFIQRPEIVESLPLEKQHEFEAQIDAVLALFAPNRRVEVAALTNRKF